MASDLAPIGISTYARISHLQRTISALQKNTLAEQSELFIFSDAAKPGDGERVTAVRSYLRTIKGFKVVHIFERESNSRTANNRGGLKLLLDRFGKVIFLEEDVITAPGFLSFMNQALEEYRNNQRVFAIAGYCPPIGANQYIHADAFLLPSCNFWGLATWKDRFDQVRMKTPVTEVFKTIGNPFCLASYMKMGPDIPYMFLLDAQGKLDAGDIKFSFEMWKKKSYLLVPTVSLSTNIGFDGSGAHCGTETKYVSEMSTSLGDHFHLPKDPELSPILIRRLSEFRSEGSKLFWLPKIYVEFARFTRYTIKQKMLTLLATKNKS